MFFVLSVRKQIWTKYKVRTRTQGAKIKSCRVTYLAKTLVRMPNLYYNRKLGCDQLRTTQKKKLRVGYCKIVCADYVVVFVFVFLLFFSLFLLFCFAFWVGGWVVCLYVCLSLLVCLQVSLFNFIETTTNYLLVHNHTQYSFTHSLPCFLSHFAIMISKYACLQHYACSKYRP